MYVCFALLLDYKTHNSVRKIIYNILRNHQVGIESSLLPQHISLKQSFFVSDINLVEDYFVSLAKEIKPVEVTFKKVDLINMGSNNNTTQVLWLDIEENQSLRAIHNKLNSDLAKLNSIPMSGFDGDQFHFHSTLTYGYNQYEELLARCELINNEYKEITFQVREIAMFYSLEEEVRAGRFIIHKNLPLINQ